MTRAWIAMGGNVGDVQTTMKRALESLRQSRAIKLNAVSSFYQTPPWGKVDQSSFLNLCCELETDLAPEELLRLCLRIEQEQGRVREEKWGPRTLDIDLLFYEGVEEYQSPRLSLPHPFLTQRPFVLQPLNEIAPDLVIHGKPVQEWNERCRDPNIVILTTQ
ncbi:2-amino-4-hydroxy-6-hydroxymethyldihydropteridine diphosphokinase [Bartonella sp. LJL80]